MYLRYLGIMCTLPNVVEAISIRPGKSKRLRIRMNTLGRYLPRQCLAKVAADTKHEAHNPGMRSSMVCRVCDGLWPCFGYAHARASYSSPGTHRSRKRAIMLFHYE